MDRFKGKTTGPSPITTETPMEDLIALVTGTTSGLGYAAASMLAAEGYRQVILTGRSLARVQETAAQLAAETKTQVFTPLELELDEPSSVQSALADLVRLGRPIDFLLLNAGLVPGKKRVLTAAGVEAAEPEKGIPPMPSLKTLRFHDLRHDAVSQLAEGQASDMTIMAIAGHVSKKMLEHYSHIRTEAKRKALDAISTPTAPPAKPEKTGNSEAPVTFSVTKLEGPGGMHSQAIEKAGGDDGARTRDLMRDRHAF